ncbi:MAG: adenosylcobalamin-dependent ribonucleoside-diphosphate reductase [Hydrogenophaga sp.]|nr:adenosylcobalamin-dependent ribonucleoside-diphosphate reductase [Hydrogenophaga sp.]
MHNEISQVVLAEKYLKKGETTAMQLFERVAAGIASAEKDSKSRKHWAKQFEKMMQDGAIGAGRIMSAAGTTIQATLINCFVQPVGDCIQGLDHDGVPGIYEALRQASETMRRGGGVGYDFSRIRPRGAFVKGTHSEASGPCSYMDVFDASCATVESAGSRRGAQMGVLRIDHPDVMEFITAKRKPGRWTNFNVSLFVEDAFFEAIEEGRTWELIHQIEPSQRFKDNNAGVYQRADGQWVYRTVDARDLWDTVMQSNYDFAEPGILLGSNINRENNLWYCENLAASNPCAEQMLPPYGCCDLGQIILTKFVHRPFTDEATFDWVTFEKCAKVLVRFLDNVLDVTYWPLEEQKLEAQAKRRIGTGYTGLGSTMAMLGIEYGSDMGASFAERVTNRLRDAVYNASVDLAIERGPFPALDKDKYLQSAFAMRLPDDLRERIAQHGIRNSHLMSIAPTGTISLAFADNCSNGIEPIFSLAYRRNKRTADGGTDSFAVMDHALRVFIEHGDVSNWCHEEKAQDFKQALLDAICSYQETFAFEDGNYSVKEVLPSSLVTAQTLTVDQHLAVLAAAQPFVDSAISKTINVPVDYPFTDFKAIYKRAHQLGLKGVACYRPNPIRGAVLEVAPAQEKPTAPKEEVASEKREDNQDPATIVLTKRPKGDLEAVVKKVAYMGPAGDATMYLTVSFVDVMGMIAGQEVQVLRPVEVFITASPDGVPSEWVAAYARSLSLLARSGIPLLAKALQDGRGVRSDKGRVRYGHYIKDDGTRVPRFHGSEVALVAYAVQEALISKGVLDVDGNPVPSMVRAKKAASMKVSEETATRAQGPAQRLAGKECKECGDHAVIRKDGCDFCTNCGSIGACG